jgi:hypothetical protein
MLLIIVEEVVQHRLMRMFSLGMYLMMRDGWNEVNVAFLKGCVLKYVVFFDFAKRVVIGIDFFGWRV